MDVSGPAGSMSPVHTHPGSEAFFVLAGEPSIRSSHGEMRVKVGQAAAGHGADADAGLEQRLDGSACPGDVCVGRHQTIFISGRFSVSMREEFSRLAARK